MLWFKVKKHDYDIKLLTTLSEMLETVTVTKKQQVPLNYWVRQRSKLSHLGLRKVSQK